MSDQQLQWVKACSKVRDIIKSLHPLVFLRSLQQITYSYMCHVVRLDQKSTTNKRGTNNTSCKTVQVEVGAAESRHEGCGHVRLQYPSDLTTGSEGQGSVETQEPNQ